MSIRNERKEEPNSVIKLKYTPKSNKLDIKKLFASNNSLIAALQKNLSPVLNNAAK